MYQFTGTTVRPGTYHLSLETASGKDNRRGGNLLDRLHGRQTTTSPRPADLPWGASNSYTAGLDWPPETGPRSTSIGSSRPNSPAIGKYLYVNYFATSANTMYLDDVSVSFTPVPEPSTLAMLAAGLIAFVAWKRKR